MVSPRSGSSSTTSTSGRRGRFTSDPDLARELLGIADRDLAAPDADELAALEIAENAVHRDARGARERGQLVLGQRELQLSRAARSVHLGQDRKSTRLNS